MCCPPNARSVESLIFVICLLVGVSVIAQVPAEQSIEPAPEAPRDRWSSLTADEFVLAVIGDSARSRSWIEVANEELKLAVYAESARRIANVTDFQSLGSSAATLVDWSENAIGEEEVSNIVAGWLVEQNGASLLPAESVEQLIYRIKDTLTSEQLQSIRANIDSASPDVSDMNFDELKSYLQRIKCLSDSTYPNLRAERQLVADWLVTQDLSGLPTQDLDYVYLHLLRPEAPDLRQITVTWSGEITPPASGQYFFDISPEVMSTSAGTNSYHQEARVEVSGQMVVRATGDNWQQLRNPIELKRGESIPFQVTLTSASRRRIPRAGIGQLYWRGPGIDQQIVPASVLSSEGAAGVNCHVVWSDKLKRSYTDEARMSEVDQVFLGTTISTFGNPFEMLVAELLERYTHLQHLSSASTEKPNTGQTKHRFVHPVVDGSGGHQLLLVHATSAQRRQFANTLIQHPDTFEEAQLWEMLKLHDLLQPGAERESLDLLGAWMTKHSNWAPRLAIGPEEYFRTNRGSFRFACNSLLWQHEDSMAWLESDYLESEDWGCSLPVAYVLAYGYLQQNRIQDWISQLDARLDDETLVGDPRVNWLIARAFAEEIRHEVADRHVRGVPNLAVGMEWLDEAMLVAESEKVKGRLRIERASRLTSLQRWEFARAELSGIDDLKSYLARANKLEKMAHQQREQEEQQAIDSYVNELERRAKRAEQRGDSASREQYLSTLQGMKSSTESDP